MQLLAAFWDLGLEIAVTNVTTKTGWSVFCCLKIRLRACSLGIALALAMAAFHHVLLQCQTKLC